jgi:anti-sigma B factor antagonist
MPVVVDPATHVLVTGRLDVSTVGRVRDEIYDALELGGGDVRVSLAGVDLLDATGLGMLVGAHRRALALDKRLVLVDLPNRVTRLLAVTRLHRILHIERAPVG